LLRGDLLPGGVLRVDVSEGEIVVSTGDRTPTTAETA